jgi:hypothetical protein
MGVGFGIVVGRGSVEVEVITLSGDLYNLFGGNDENL